MTDTVTDTGHEVSWDDETIKSGSRGQMEKFRLDNNETARMVILDENAFLAMTHFDKEKSKRYIRCIKDVNNGNCPACSRIGEPKQRFGANVIQYKTTKQGELLEPYEWTVKLWTFGPDKFTQLRAIKKEWGDLRQVDLKVLCKDQQFQDHVITPLPKCLWLSEEAGIKDQVVADYKDNKYDIEKVIGKQYSESDVNDILDGVNIWERDRKTQDESTAPPPEVVEAAVADIEEELKKEAAKEEPTEEVSVDFDSLLDDLA